MRYCDLKSLDDIFLLLRYFAPLGATVELTQIRDVKIADFYNYGKIETTIVKKYELYVRNNGVLHVCEFAGTEEKVANDILNMFEKLFEINPTHTIPKKVVAFIMARRMLG